LLPSSRARRGGAGQGALGPFRRPFAPCSRVRAGGAARAGGVRFHGTSRLGRRARRHRPRREPRPVRSSISVETTLEYAWSREGVSQHCFTLGGLAPRPAPPAPLSLSPSREGGKQGDAGGAGPGSHGLGFGTDTSDAPRGDTERAPGNRFLAARLTAPAGPLSSSDRP